LGGRPLLRFLRLACNCQSVESATKAESANVWSRGVTRWFRCSLSVADSFVCRCLTSCTMLPSSHPAHRTGYADFRFRLSEKPPGDLIVRFPDLSGMWWRFRSVRSARTIHKYVLSEILDEHDVRFVLIDLRI